MAQVLKDNPVITTVSPPSFYHFSSFPFIFSFTFSHSSIINVGYFFLLLLFSSSSSLSLSLQLELSYNPIGPDGAKALSEVLKFHGKINTLKLGWCQVITE